MLTGLLEPTRGKSFVQWARYPKDLAGFRECLGYVPEGTQPLPYLSGREYLELVGTLRECPFDPGGKIDALLDLFSLHPHRHPPLRLLERDAPTHPAHRALMDNRDC